MISQIPRFYQFLDQMEKAKSAAEYGQLIDEYGATLEAYPNPAAAKTVKELAKRIFAVAPAVSERLNSYAAEFRFPKELMQLIIDHSERKRPWRLVSHESWHQVAAVYRRTLPFDLEMATAYVQNHAKFLTRLSIGYSFFFPNSTLRKLLQPVPHLQSLDGRWDLNQENAQILVDSLNQLTQLDLSKHSGFRPDSSLIKVLANGPNLSRLKSLKLGGKLSQETGRELGDSKFLGALTKLHLCHCNLGDSGVGELLKGSFRLIKLNLEWNEIGPRGVQTLATSPATATLKTLDLGFNLLGDRGVALLAQSSQLSELGWLNLRNNRLSDAGWEALASFQELTQFGIQFHPSCQNSSPIS